MKIVELIRQSLLEDSNVSSMRVNVLLTLCAIIGPYVVANLGQTVMCIIDHKAITFLDIPAVAGTVVLGIIGAKTAQAIFGEKPKAEGK